MSNVKLKPYLVGGGDGGSWGSCHQAVAPDEPEVKGATVEMTIKIRTHPSKHKPKEVLM